MSIFYKTHRQYLEASVRDWKSAAAQHADEPDTNSARDCQRLLRRAICELEFLDVDTRETVDPE